MFEAPFIFYKLETVCWLQALKYLFIFFVSVYHPPPSPRFLMNECLQTSLFFLWPPNIDVSIF